MHKITALSFLLMAVYSLGAHAQTEDTPEGEPVEEERLIAGWSGEGQLGLHVNPGQQRLRKSQCQTGYFQRKRQMETWRQH